MNGMRKFLVGLLICFAMIFPTITTVRADTPAAPNNLSGVRWAYNQGCTMIWGQEAQPVTFHVYLNGVYNHDVAYVSGSGYTYNDSFFCGPNSATDTIDVYAQDGEGDWSAKAEYVLQPV